VAFNLSCPAAFDGVLNQLPPARGPLLQGDALGGVWHRARRPAHVGAPTDWRRPAPNRSEPPWPTEIDRPGRYCFRPQVPELSNGPSAEALSVMLPYFLS